MSQGQILFSQSFSACRRARYMSTTASSPKSGICRFFLMTKMQQENLDQIISECILRQRKKRRLIVIGRCNPLALKKLNQKYRSVVSVNRNSTNYEVDEVLCDGRKSRDGSGTLISLVTETSVCRKLSETRTVTMVIWIR